ncbi:optic atrophy 3 protein homolog [Amphiura filiformis]|uniref:optic atrophy 3 protein homolog n=1 Tax=Amphiura filiformis TaxID=82378 RepID=UPI003B21414B
MVVAAFPVVKLGILAFKQISKPIAKQIAAAAKNSPFLRQHICMRIANFHHFLDVNLRMRSLGLGKAKSVEPLKEEAAVELGANIISEVFLFSVGAGTIAYEYYRQAKKSNTREENQLQDIDELQLRVEQMGLQLEQQSAELRELQRLVLAEPWRKEHAKQIQQGEKQKDAKK